MRPRRATRLLAEQGLRAPDRPRTLSGRLAASSREVLRDRRVKEMSRDGMARLKEVVRAAVAGAEGSPELAMAMLATELRTHPNLLLDVLKELSDMGSQSRHRAPAAVDRARGLVNGVLRACGFHDRWPNLATLTGLVAVGRSSIRGSRPVVMWSLRAPAPAIGPAGGGPRDGRPAGTGFRFDAGAWCAPRRFLGGT